MSSLRDFDRIEDRIRQHRQVSKSAVLLIEGPDDFLVLKEHIAPSVLFPADGKANVLRASVALQNWGVGGVRGLVDVDFDGDPVVDHVLCYDARDLEAMLIQMGVLSSVIEHQGSGAKLTAAGGSQSLVDTLVDALLPIARLRAANMQFSWGLRFDEVSLASKANLSTLEINLHGYCAALISASETTASLRDLLGHLEPDQLDERGPRGRDVVALAGVALRRKVGGLTAAASQEEIISAQLRSSAGLTLDRSAWMGRLRTELAAADVEAAA